MRYLHSPILEFDFDEFVGAHDGCFVGTILVRLYPILSEGTTTCLGGDENTWVFFTFVVLLRESVFDGVDDILSGKFGKKKYLFKFI